MKSKLTFFALCFLMGNAARADFIPGRVRAHALSQMQVSEATGVFAGVKEVTIAMNFEDGSPDAVTFTAAIERASNIVLPILEVGKDECSQQYGAQSASNEAVRYVLQLQDFSTTPCQSVLKDLWAARLLRVEANGQQSVLQLTGKPIILMLTQ